MYDDYQDILTADRPAPLRKSMDIPHRAKQFAPFAALKGFEDCVRKKEVIYEPKRELAEDQQAELNFRMRMLQYGMRVTVTYFQPISPAEKKGFYEDYSGEVRSWDAREGLLIGERVIPPEDLYDLKGDDFDREETNWYYKN